MAVMIKGDRPKVGVDLHVLEGIRQGSQTHCSEIFRRISSKAPEIDFALFVDKRYWTASQDLAFSAPNAELIDMPHKNPVSRLLWQLPFLVARHRVDLLHTQYICPPFLSAERSVSIHDILFEEFPQYFKQFMRLRSKIFFRASARAADILLTGSEYSKMKLAALYGVPAAKIEIIHNAANSAVFYPGKVGCEKVASLGLTPGAYLITVGRLEPRKNHLGLLKAYAMLAHPRPRLVIVGQRDFGYEAIFQFCTQAGLQDDVLFCESADDDLLGALYRCARVFVYPTFAEGFGMPVVEAMASGIPVITSNTTSLPEVAGNAALLVDPASTEDICSAMMRVLADPSLAAEMVAHGFRHIERFDWEQSAQKFANIYLKHFGLSTL